MGRGKYVDVLQYGLASGLILMYQCATGKQAKQTQNYAFILSQRVNFSS